MCFFLFIDLLFDTLKMGHLSQFSWKYKVLHSITISHSISLSWLLERGGGYNEGNILINLSNFFTW